MAKDGRPTWFRMNFEEFFSDGNVAALTATELGVFLRLLRRAWQENPPASIPDDDAKLARWAGADSSWSDCKSAVLSCFERVGDRLVYPHLLAEYERAQFERRAGRERAKKSESSRSLRAEHAKASNSDSGSGSGSSGGGAGEPLAPVRLLPNHVRPLYDAYPETNRGPFGEFQAALQDGAWAVLAARGEPDPLGVLLPVVVAYSQSWAVSRFTYGPRRFFAPDGVWTQSPDDWREPGQAAPVDFDKVAELASKGRRRSA
jgi:uncharacterized protein YdaU (DUF1376 family)